LFFHLIGDGCFHPPPGSAPALGKVGREQRVSEVRLETRILRHQAEKVLAAIRRAHPYEEPVVDLYPIRGLEPAPDRGGWGTGYSLRGN